MARPRTNRTTRADKAGVRAARLLDEKVLDVLERLLEASDDKLQLAAAKEIRDIARGSAEVAEQGEAKPSRVFVVTGIERKPGEGE